MTELPGIPTSPKFTKAYTWLVLLLVLAGVFFATLYQISHQATQNQQFDYLKTVGDLKTAELAEWVQERKRDMHAWEHFIQAEGIDSVHGKLSLHTQGAWHASSHETLSGFLFAPTTLHAVVVLSSRHELIRRFGENIPVDATHLTANLPSDYQRGTVQTAFLPLKTGETLLTFMKQIELNPTQQNSPLAWLIGFVELDRYLFAELQRWPIPSDTGEVLLVRSHEGQVQFLNSLRFSEAAPLTLFQSLSNPDLPAARSINGETGEITGLDYRKIPVWAAIRQIPGTDWHLVAKISAFEALAPQRTLYWVLVIAWIGLGILGVAFIQLAQKESRIGLIRTQLSSEEKRRQNIEQQRDVIFTLSSAFYAQVDRHQSIVSIHPDWAPQLLQTTTHPALPQAPVSQLFHPDDWKRILLALDRPEGSHHAPLEVRIKTAISTYHWYRLVVHWHATHELYYLVGQDIQVLKQRQHQERQVSDILRLITRCHETADSAEDELSLLKGVAHVLEQHEDYDFIVAGTVTPAGDLFTPLFMVGDEMCVQYFITHCKAHAQATANPDDDPALVLPWLSHCRITQSHHNLHEDPHFAPCQTLFSKAEIESLLIMPLQLNQKESYRLIVFSRDPEQFSEAETFILSEFGNSLDLKLTEMKQYVQLRASQESANMWAQIVACMSDGVVVTDPHLPDNPVIAVNPAFETITGYAPEDIIGQNCRVLNHGEAIDQGQNIRTAIEQNTPIHVQLQNYRKDGTRFWNSLHISPVKDLDGNTRYFVGIQRDVSERMHYIEQLEYQSSHDTLTGLPNLRAFQQQAAHDIAHAQREHSCMVIVHLDVDNMQTINRRHGRHVGDQLLKALGRRLQKHSRSTDGVCRIEGDEFALSLEQLDTPEQAGVLVEQLLSEVQTPFVHGDLQIDVLMSAGIARFPEDGETIEELLKAAELATVTAKSDGGNTIRYLSAAISADLDARLELQDRLRLALASDAFAVYYQPQVDVANGRVVGLEALIRWHDPERGMISPLAFISVAEESGLIIPIGNWVIDQVIRDMQLWESKGLTIPRVAINISAVQFRRKQFLPELLERIERSGLPTHRFELEVTESLMLEDLEGLRQRFHALRERGIYLSLDDFGTGYSSLNYLNQLPVNRVKIDRSFITDITHSPQHVSIVRAVISIAKAMGIECIAEGVETEAQLAFLRRYHCPVFQGYLFMKPMPEADLMKLLDDTERSFRSQQVRSRPTQRTLLMLDDEQHVLSALKRLFRHEGYQLLSTTEIQEAFELLAAQEVQVILCDQRMPQLSGSEFLRRVKQIHPETVRIILSGYTDLKTVTDSVNEGATYKFLTKPWEDEDLKAQVRAAFEHHEALKMRNQPNNGTHGPQE